MLSWMWGVKDLRVQGESSMSSETYFFPCSLQGHSLTHSPTRPWATALGTSHQLSSYLASERRLGEGR